MSGRSQDGCPRWPPIENYLAVPSSLEARPTTGHTGHGFHEIRLESLAEPPPGHVLTVRRDGFRHAAAQLASRLRGRPQG
jgi:hypothetical protein